MLKRYIILIIQIIDPRTADNGPECGLGLLARRHAAGLLGKVIDRDIHTRVSFSLRMLGLKHPNCGKQWKLLAFKKKYPGRGGLSTGDLLPGGAQRRRCSPGNNPYETEQKLDHRN